MDEMLAWIDQQSDKMLVHQVAVADAIDRQAVGLLHLLLVASGGALAWALSMFKEGAALPFWAGMAAMAVWLFGVAALLQARVMMTGDFFVPGYDAQPAANNLEKVSVDRAQWMRWMMDHRQQSIDANRRRNRALAVWLNRCRWLAIATPLTGAVAATFSLYR